MVKLSKLDADPEYANTPLVSPVPPPNSFSAPRLSLSVGKRGRGRGGPYPRNLTRGDRPEGPRHYPPERQSSEGPGRLQYDSRLFRQLVDHLPSDVKDLPAVEDLCQMVFVKAGCESNLQLVDVKLVERFKALEAELGKRGAGAMRTALVRSSPSYRVLRLIFNSQEGTQLANLDAALQLTAPLAGSAFLAIAAAPGRFSEYLLWRAGRPVRGWGLCAGPTTAQPFPFLPQCQADGRYATLNAAELGWREADNLVASKFKAGGVGLAIADLPPADSKDEGSPVYQKHLLLNTLLCLRAVQPGGSCVLKLAGLTTELTLQVVWLLRRVFKQLSVIRPFSLGSMSGCVYVVYQNLAQDTRVAVEALTSALEAVERSGGPLQRFLDRSLVEADVRLVDLVRAFNQRLLASRIETVKLALGFVEDSSKPPLGPPTPKMLAYAKLEWALDP